jgi:hypothetical protein
MLATFTEIQTIDGSFKPLKLLISEANDGIINTVYTSDLNGKVSTSKILSGIKTTEKTYSIMLDNWMKIYCTANHVLPIQAFGYKRVKDIIKNDCIISFSYIQHHGEISNLDTFVYDHVTKSFLPNTYLIDDKPGYMPFKSRNIIDFLPTDTSNVYEYIQTISKNCISKDQVCGKLSNDGIFKCMLSVEHFTKDEMLQLIDFFGIRCNEKKLSEDENRLMQFLMINVPSDETTYQLAGMFAKMKKHPGGIFRKCGIEVGNRISVNNLNEAARLVGYAGIDHLISSRILYGMKVAKVTECDPKEVGTLVLERGEMVGLKCGIFSVI